MTNSPVRVFIGSGEASRLERKVLMHSLARHTRRELELHVFNGTHDTVEVRGRAPVPAALPLSVKYRNVTEFSNYRFLIPALCGHQGRAIYLDSDMICLADIGELFDADLQGGDLLAKAEAYTGSARWGLSVMLLDCARARFDVSGYFQEIERGSYSVQDLHQLSPAFLRHHPFTVRPLSPHWNVFDRVDRETKLIHYTNLLTQPWKFPGHPHARLWFQTLADALRAGAVDEEDIELSLLRGYVRPDLRVAMCGASRRRRLLGAVRSFIRSLREV